MARRLVVLGAAVLCGCSRTHSTLRRPSVSTPAFVYLPLDSIVRTLGPDVGRNGLSVSPMSNEEYPDGRYEWDYSLEFTAPAHDMEVVGAIATRLMDLARLRGIRVTGYTLSGDAGIESFSYETRSAKGWVSVVSLKPRRDNLDHFLVAVREYDAPEYPPDARPHQR